MKSDILNDNESLRFLVVDDDNTNRIIVERMLIRMGHTVDIATNGQEAIDSYSPLKHDIIIMDVMMPIVNGYEACKTIKNNNKNIYIPIIFITAISDDESLSECIKCGGDDFLTKPFNNIILKAKIIALSRTIVLYRLIRKKTDELQKIHSQLQREHELAEDIFSRISTPPESDQKDMNYFISPHSVSSGDVLMYQEHNGHQYAMLGDFTGHGLSAAIGAIPTTEIFYRMTRKNYTIDLIAKEINEKLNNILPTGLYCAASIIDINNNNGTIDILNAGIPDTLILFNKEEKLINIQSTNLPLGISIAEYVNPTITTIDFDQSGFIYLYSDGVTESKNSEKQMLGQDAIEAIITSSRGNDSFSIITEKVNSFSASSEQEDDITMAEIKISAPNLNKINRGVLKSTQCEISYEFDNLSIKNNEPITTIIDGLHNYMNSISLPNSPSIAIIITELLSNEIDHAILHLDSSIKKEENGFEKYIELKKEKIKTIENQFIKITITLINRENHNSMKVALHSSGDSSPDNFINNALVDSNPYGRGLHIINELCDSFSFDSEKKCTYIEYSW